MTAEGLWLHHLGGQRHDSMYLMLPVCMVFLFSLLLGRKPGPEPAGGPGVAAGVCAPPLVHRGARAGAKLLGLEQLLIENSLGHFAGGAGPELLGAWVLQPAAARAPEPQGSGLAEIDLEAFGPQRLADSGRPWPRSAI